MHSVQSYKSLAILFSPLQGPLYLRYRRSYGFNHSEFAPRLLADIPEPFSSGIGDSNPGARPSVTNLAVASEAKQGMKVSKAWCQRWPV